MQRLAALANAHWCNMVLSAQGISTRNTDALWLAHTTPPPFYPAIVTLMPNAGASVNRTLAEQGHLGAVKDSFADLDLTADGYRIVIEGTWLCATGVAQTTAMQCVQTPAGLAAWHAQWAKGEDLQPDFCMFPSSLLARPDVRFAAFGSTDAPVAGGALNHRAGVTHLSNLFGTKHPDLHVGLVTLAQTLWPGDPVVMWDCGATAARAVAHGFRAFAPMRIWAR